MNVANEALNYARKGFSVIPIGKDKKPTIEWKKYQSERADEKQIEKWFSGSSTHNIGIVTGKISGIVVVDVEDGGDIKDLPPTIISRTGGGGWHFYYKHPGRDIKNAVRIRDRMDIRGDGGYVVAPPSLHNSGKRYEWSVSPFGADFTELPLWIIEKLGDSSKNKTDWQGLLNKEVLEGSRNFTAAQIAGKLLHHLPVEFWDISGWATMKEWNDKKNKPPLSEKELHSTWESIRNKESKNRQLNRGQEGKGSQSKKLLELVEEIDDIVFFHDDLGEPYVRFPINGHYEIWKCKNKKFKIWLSSLAWKDKNLVPNSDSLNNVLNILVGRAYFEGEERTLANRVTYFEDSIWYDLTNKGWNAVKISKTGWSIINNPPILFRRYTHQKPQISPAVVGDIHMFLEFINITNENHKILLLVYLVSCFIPDLAHPILLLHGSQGSAKSTLSRLLGGLIDPSVIEVSEFPSNSAEFNQKLFHHWYIFFDNLSSISEEFSNKLSRAVTGSGFSKRELYSDDDDIIYTIKRCIGINGINIVSSKPDLLERSILIELERIPEDKRRTDAEIFSEFEKNKPQILGAIFNVISKAMLIEPDIKLDNFPRMADFSKWGCAIAEAMGYKKEVFLKAYSENINAQNSEVINDNLEATSIIEFLKDKTDWQGSASQLLSELEKTARAIGINVDKEKSFPKAANVLSKRLNQIKPNLAQLGIKFENKNRTIAFQKIEKDIVSIENRNANDNDTND